MCSVLRGRAEGRLCRFQRRGVDFVGGMILDSWLVEDLTGAALVPQRGSPPSYVSDGVSGARGLGFACVPGHGVFFFYVFFWI